MRSPQERTIAALVMAVLVNIYKVHRAVDFREAIDDILQELRRARLDEELEQYERFIDMPPILAVVAQPLKDEIDDALARRPVAQSE